MGRRGSSIRRDRPEPPNEDKAIKAIVGATMIHSHSSMPTFISMGVGPEETPIRHAPFQR